MRRRIRGPEDVRRPPATDGRLPRGYWPETQRMARLFRRGRRDLLWELVGRLASVIRRAAGRVRAVEEVFWLEDDELLQIGRLETAEMLIGGYDPDGGAKVHVYLGQWLPSRMLRAAKACAPIRSAAVAQNEELAERASRMLMAVRLSVPEVPEGALAAEEPGFEAVMLEDSYLRFATGVDLPEADARVLAARFGLSGAEEKTLAEVAEEFGRSREWVRQRQEKALAAIRRRNLASYGISVRIGRDTGGVVGPAPAVVGGYFSLGDLSAEPERSASSPAEWVGEILPFKRVSAGGCASSRGESLGSERGHGQERFAPAPRRRASSGNPDEPARRALEEDGVVRASEASGQAKDPEREAVVRRLRGMGLVKVAVDYWAAPLSLVAGRAALRTLRERGPMPLGALLSRLRFHPAVRAADLPASAAFGPLLDAHPSFSVDDNGLVRAAGEADGPPPQSP